MSGNPRSAASLTGITRTHTCCIFAFVFDLDFASTFFIFVLLYVCHVRHLSIGFADCFQFVFRNKCLNRPTGNRLPLLPMSTLSIFLHHVLLCLL